MQQVVERENMRRAWRRVKANRGAPGIDGQRIAETEIWLRTNWTTLRESLLSGTYQPWPLRRKAIPKPSGGERLLGIPVVVDRLIQQAIAQVLGPIFDPGFSESSFGFRPRRSAHGALRQVQAFLRAGYRIAMDLVIENLMASLKQYLADELRLTGNEAKSRVAPINECVFLGFTFRGTKLRWSDTAFNEFRYRLKGFTGRSWGLDP